MFKTIALKIARIALSWGANYLYNYVDKDKDGRISVYELEIIVEDVRKTLTKIKRKI